MQLQQNVYQPFDIILMTSPWSQIPMKRQRIASPADSPERGSQAMEVLMT